MAQIVADLHTHTLVSGHAYGTIREMAYEASNHGIKLLGISEHAPGIPGTVNPIYYMNLGVIPRTLSGVEIIHGCEINVLNDGTLSLEQRYIDQLDYAIVGIHRQCYQDEGRQKNTENMIECMKHEKVCFVSHPDDDHTPLDYELLVKAARQYHVALELNNSSLGKVDQRLNCVQNYKTMLGLCMEHGVNIIVSSDAHDPSWVGKFDLACNLLEEIKFSEDLILNGSVEKVKEFIR
ncbi:MAG TPA: phosphatase [Pseudoflavonifractor sp.]|nr:phosphatase [Pseudoflavonifractor sp.]